MDFLDRRYRDLMQRPSLPRWVRTGLTAVAVVARKSAHDSVPVRAGTLSYWSLVALVPGLILTALVLRALGLDAWLSLSSFAGRALTALLPDWDSVGLPAEVDAQKIGVVGLVVAFSAATRIFLAAEEAYNRIWNAPVKRALATRLSIFYVALTIVPVLVAFGFSLSARAEVAVVSSSLQLLTPVLVTASLFTIAQRTLPDTTVSWRAAILGGTLTAATFELLKVGFSAYIDLFTSPDTTALIYGSLAFVPLLLLWVYIAWTIVLVGVEVGVVVERWSELARAEARRLSGAERRTPDAIFALQAMIVVVQQFLVGGGASPQRHITERLGSDSEHVSAALQLLVEAGLLGETSAGFVPLAPPQQTRAVDVLRRYRELSRPATDPGAPGNDLAAGVADSPTFARTLAELAAS